MQDTKFCFSGSIYDYGENSNKALCLIDLYIKFGGTMFDGSGGFYTELTFELYRFLFVLRA